VLTVREPTVAPGPRLVPGAELGNRDWAHAPLAAAIVVVLTAPVSGGQPRQACGLAFHSACKVTRVIDVEVEHKLPAFAEWLFAAQQERLGGAEVHLARGREGGWRAGACGGPWLSLKPEARGRRGGCCLGACNAPSWAWGPCLGHVVELCMQASLSLGRGARALCGILRFRSLKSERPPFHGSGFRRSTVGISSIL